MRSMTGYGSGSFQNEFYGVDVEIKTLNNRFLDVTITSGDEFNHLHSLIRKHIGKTIKRGKVYVIVNVESTKKPPLELNKELLQRLSEIYKEAYALLTIDKQLDIDEIMKHEGIIVRKQQRNEDEKLLDALFSALDTCLQVYKEMAANEGEIIKSWLLKSMERIENELHSISAHVPVYRNELKSRLTKNVEDILVSPADKEIEKKLLAEVAFYMDRYDVNEEVVRLKDHMEKMNGILNNDTRESGKRMNFILQEMQREIQTISSKFNNIKVFPSILTIKEEIEKCRELIQNVE